MKSIVQKELNKRTTFSSKIKYLAFAYKFELIVAAVVIFFVVFFLHSILIHDTAVLNVGIYTSSKKGPSSYQTSSIQGEINKVLKINYNHNRDTAEVETGSMMKISDIAKMNAMSQAGELDIMVIGKDDFDQNKTHPKNFKAIPHKLVKKVGKENALSYKGRVVGIRAKKLSIFKNIVTKKDILCIPSNGKNVKETNKFIDYLAK